MSLVKRSKRKKVREEKERASFHSKSKAKKLALNKGFLVKCLSFFASVVNLIKRGFSLLKSDKFSN